MYCLIQFYIQLRHDLAPHRPFLKVLAIKLVIFLSFWQSFMISILTSATFNVVKPNAKIAYPDLKVGIPSLLLCIEMAIFAVLHLFAFPWKPYTPSGAVGIPPYPLSPIKNTLGPKQGGPLGFKALVDAMNPWDLIKGFARGMRWLFVGVKRRETDASYKTSSFDINNPQNNDDMSLQPQTPGPYKQTHPLPIADEFRRSKFGLPGFGSKKGNEEVAGLIAHAQPNPLNQPSTPSSGYVPARQRYDSNGQDISSGGAEYPHAYESQSPDRLLGHHPAPQGSEAIGMALSDPPEAYHSHVTQAQTYRDREGEGLEPPRMQRRGPSPSEQWGNASQPVDPNAHVIHGALWGQQSQAQQQGREQQPPIQQEQQYPREMQREPPRDPKLQPRGDF